MSKTPKVTSQSALRSAFSLVELLVVISGDSFTNRLYFAGDFDADFDDVSIFSQHWLQSGYNEPY